MSLLTQGFIFFLLVKSQFCIKVLKTPKMGREAPADAFSRFINVKSPILTNISSCHWMSKTFENLGYIWRSKNETEYFGMRIYSMGTYLDIGGNAIRVEFPKDFFVPDKWFFYCFTYNNMRKRLKVYLDSGKIIDKVINKHLDSFLIGKDFLQYEEFGRAGIFAGKFTDLNIWSRILNDYEIKKFYIC